MARSEGAAEAERIYDNAEHVHATAFNMLVEFGHSGLRLNTTAVPDHAVQDIDGAAEWASLFGSLELCDCGSCGSVTSPAAYLVDLLHFLSDRPSKRPGTSAKDVLFERRGDLGDIELTCENTNTKLPYVDLVNEALENAVAPYPDVRPVRARTSAGTGSRGAADRRDAVRRAPQPVQPAAVDRSGRQRQWCR